MYVGQERQSMTSSYVNSKSWEADSPEDKKDYLNLIYKRGYDYGKDKWMRSVGLNVKFKFDAPIDIQMLQHRINNMKRDIKP
jgi:hypothetical protein